MNEDSAVLPVAEATAHREELLDRALEDSFPASDPVSSNLFR